MFRKPNQLVGYVFGATFILLGVLGFPVTGGHSFAGSEGGQMLGIFGVNTLHNIVHLTAGAVLILGAVAGEAIASRVNATLGAFYIVAATVGLLIADGALNLLALNLADNLVHLANGFILLGVGMAGLRAARRHTPVSAVQHGN
jgi:hypothetical protein